MCNDRPSGRPPPPWQWWAPPAALSGTPQIIPVLADSHRMLIPNHLFYCNVKPGSSSQSLLLLSSTLSLSITFHPPLKSAKIPPPNSQLHPMFNHVLLTRSSPPPLKSVDPTGKRQGLIPILLSFLFAPGPGLAISPTLIFSFPRKQNTNQPVIITLLEEEAPNAKHSCYMLM